MNIQIAPIVATKISEFAGDPTVLSQVSFLVKAIEAASNANELLQQIKSKTKALDTKLFVVNLGSIRAFVNIENDYVLLLDIASSGGTRSTQPFGIGNDPAHNPALNPYMNTAINPTFNTTLNPVFNTAINPIFNTALNPVFNTAINPIFNTTLNPTFNTVLNPSFNTALNPIFNTMINPTFNSLYSGPYIYDLALKREGYIVRANESVDLLFDLSGKYSGIGVHLPEGVEVALFDGGMRWMGYLVPDHRQGHLRFDTNAQWTGLVV